LAAWLHFYVAMMLNGLMGKGSKYRVE